MFFAAREMFGDVAALMALLLFVFDPLILAHGPLLGTDMGATCCIFAAIYAFYRYANGSRWHGSAFAASRPDWHSLQSTRRFSSFP